MSDPLSKEKKPKPKTGVADDLIQSGLWAQIPLHDIYKMTPEEIFLTFEIENKRQKDFYRAMAWLIYNGAALSGVAFNDPRKFPSIEDAFPSLFSSDNQQDWWVMKQRVEEYGKKKHYNRSLEHLT